MITNRNISIIGGDSRLVYAAEYLAKNNNTVEIYGCDHYDFTNNLKNNNLLNEAFRNQIILLPLPVSKNGKSLNSPLSSNEIALSEIINSLSDKHYVFLGMGQPSFIKQVVAKTPNICDYFSIETFTYKNAGLTAEGILSIIIEKLPISLYKLKVGISGFGRIGEMLTKLLVSAGAEVSVFARNDEQRLKAEYSGAKSYTIQELPNEISKLDCFVNTVPKQIILENTIINSQKDCLFIETASFPYGISFDDCIKYNRRLIKAFSLPGKISPKTAGLIIAETISDYLQEV